MKFLTHPLILLMLLGILARLLVAVALVKRRLAGKYLGVMAYLVGGALRSSWLIWCGVQSPTGYHDAWIATQAMPIILTTLLIGECHFYMARHFRNTSLFAVLSVMAYAVVSWMVVVMASPAGLRTWPEPAGIAIALQRNYTLGGMLVLWLCRHYWYSSPTTELRRNVRLIVDSLFLALAVEWLALVVIRGLPIGTLVWIAEYAIAAVPVALSAVWWTLRPSGEQWMRPGPIAAGSTAAADEEMRRIAERMKEGE